MEKAGEIKLFVSYSHKDAEDIEMFISHMAPLKNKGVIDIWLDQKINAGQEFHTEIDSRIELSDIICLFISVNFLASDSCLEEKRIGFELMKKRGVLVVPIVLTHCGWRDYNEMAELIALPTDGKPISSYSDRDEAWNIVYEGIKKLVYQEKNIRELEVSPEFQVFLQSTEMLTTAHFQKEEVLLDDIFVYPELSKFDNMRNFDEKIGLEALVEEIFESPRIIIAGENQSGKTSICKKLFGEFRNMNFVPVYLFDTTYEYHGKMETRIFNALADQYVSIEPENIDKQRIIPIIDDFQFAKNKGKRIAIPSPK